MNIRNMLSSVNVASGFSWDCLNDEAPTTGYAVSPFKDRETIFDTPPTVFDIVGFILENAMVLFEKGFVLGARTKVIGCWQYEGRYYLDVSLIYYDKTQALQTGLACDQIAIWDIENAQEVLCEKHKTAIYLG